MLANPITNPEQFDKVIAAGIPNPGVASVTGAATLYKWDKKDGPGAAGANMTFRGLDLSEFKIEVQLWTAEQLDAWPAWADLWGWDPVKKKATPLEVVHPLLDERRIRTVAAKGVPQLSNKGGSLWIGTIDCIEWRPPPKKNVAASPSSVKSGAAGAAQPTAQDELDRQIAGLLEQAKKV